MSKIYFFILCFVLNLFYQLANARLENFIEKWNIREVTAAYTCEFINFFIHLHYTVESAYKSAVGESKSGSYIWIALVCKLYAKQGKNDSCQHLLNSTPTPINLMLWRDFSRSNQPCDGSKSWCSSVIASCLDFSIINGPLIVEFWALIWWNQTISASAISSLRLWRFRYRLQLPLFITIFRISSSFCLIFFTVE